MLYRAEEKRGKKQRRGKDGDKGIMTGWERHPCGESGKRVQGAGAGGHTFMLTKCASPRSGTDRVRAEEHWGF